jgi:ribosome-associated translation inhibitor RaiA
MNYPIRIRFSGLESSPALTAAAEAHAHGLAWAESEIIACWVGIQFDPEQQSSGRPYSVRVDVAIPGHELVAQRVQHEDVHLALGHAFQDMEQQLKAIDPRINHAEYAVTINGQIVLQQASDKPVRQPR